MVSIKNKPSICASRYATLARYGAIVGLIALLALPLLSSSFAYSNLSPSPGSVIGGALRAGPQLAARGTRMLVSYNKTVGKAKVETDKPDYAPGDRVIITGTGWKPGEIVQLHICRDNNTPDELFKAKADSGGKFRHNELLIKPSDIGVAFVLTATGLRSKMTATVNFTDANVTVESGNQFAASQPSGFQTFTLTKRIFTGSTDCTTGGGAVTTENGVGNQNPHTFAVNVGDSVILTAPQFSNENGQFVGWSSPTGGVVNGVGPTSICVPGTASAHTYVALYSPGILILDDTCTTPKTNFILGETVCARVYTDPMFNQRFLFSDPASMGRFGPVQITMDQQVFTFMLPSTQMTGMVDNRGTWQGRIIDVDAGGRGSASFVVTDPMDPAADIQVSKNSISSTAVPPGGTIQYDIQLANAGPNPGVNVVLTDMVPANTTLVSFEQISGPMAMITGNTAGSTGTVTATIPSLPVLINPAATDDPNRARFRMIVQVNMGVADMTIITNTASATSDTDDPIPGNNMAAAGNSVFATGCSLTCPPDITATADTTCPAGPPGNGMPGAVVNFPSNPTPTGSCGAMINCFPPSGSCFPVGMTTVQCSENLGSASCSFVVTVNAGSPCTPPPAGMVSWWPGDGNANDIQDGNNGTLQNGATATAMGQVAQAFSFDGVDDFVNVANNANLEPAAITVDFWFNSAAPGANAYLLAKGANACNFASYSFNTADAGGGLAFDVLVNGTLVRSPFSPPTVFNGEWHLATGTYDGSVVRLYIDGVEVGTGTPAVGAITYNLPTTNDLSFGRYNGTCVISYAGLLDEVEIFNTALTQPEIQAIFAAGSGGKCKPEANISVTKTASPMGDVIAGNNITYTITVTNNGPDDAVNVTLTDMIPANTTFVSASAPAGWMLTTPPVGGTGTLTASADTLSMGTSAVFMLVVNVNANTPAGTTISNTASAMSSTPDSTPGDNTSAAATNNVVTQADLVIDKTGPATVNAGGNITYTISLTNNGPSDAQNVSLSDMIPANTTFVSRAQTGGPTFTCNTPAAMGGTLTCTAASLAAGATANFELVVNVGCDVPNNTVISNTSQATSTTTDPTTPNTDTVMTTVLQTAPMFPVPCAQPVTAVAPLTCPPATGAVVNFATPGVVNSGSCPVTVVCDPPSGSTFPVGTTTVTCTATNAAMQTATCTFPVTVFNGCLQDDTNPGNVVLFNTFTGEYRFCCNGAVVATGVGTLTKKGCTVTIQHNTTTRRVTIRADFSVKSGNASLMTPPGSVLCTITDKNMANNTCFCQ